MPKPCAVCAHAKRAEIDERLALQVVNVVQLAREYGLGRDSVRRHREKHLPAFLRAFAADASPRRAGELRAEAERLYLVSLDALARAEAGVLVGVDEHGVQTRRVNSSAVARMIREARAGLDLLVKLSAASGEPETQVGGVNAELDTRIAAALDRVSKRHELTAAVVDAEVVAEPGGAATTTPGPGAAAAGRVLARQEGPIFSEIASEEPVRNAPFEQWSGETREVPWTGNPAASEEERRAAGHGHVPVRSARETVDGDPLP